MAFSRPTLQQIIDRIASDFVAKIAGASTLALRSVLLIMGRAYGGAVHLLYGYLDNMSKELFAKTASADADGGKLDTIGSEYSIFRKSATPAIGNVNCTGTPATVIPATTALTSPAGNRYLVNSSVSIGDGGTAVVSVTCDTASEAGNDNAGVVLSFESPIAGVNSTAVVDSNGLAGGTDTETDDDLRERILLRKQSSPHGGTQDDIINWTLEVPDVTRAWVYPQYQGPGTLAVYFVCDGQSPITPTASQITDVKNYLTAHTDITGQTAGVPITMLPGLFVFSPVLRQMNYTIKVYPNTSVVQTNVIAQVKDFLLREGYPANTLYASQLAEAVSAAAGELRSTVVGNTDTTLAYNEVALYGNIVFQDY